MTVRFFGELSKAERQQDGTLIVKGIASSEAVDGEGETIRAEAIRAAIPDYMAFGAVREMHQPIAAGVALKCEVGADGRTRIEARIVDPVTIRKVESGVLRGFSVGGRVTGRDSLDKTVITGIRLTEISLVDRPCNPEALVSLCKAGADEDGEEEKEKEAEKEEAEEESEAEAESGKEDDDDDKDDEDAEKLAKLSRAHGAALAKILTLQAELAELRKRAAPPKGAVRAVGKGEDAPRAGAEADLRKQAEAIDALPQMQRAAALVQIIHGRG